MKMTDGKAVEMKEKSRMAEVQNSNTQRTFETEVLQPQLLTLKPRPTANNGVRIQPASGSPPKIKPEVILRLIELLRDF